jgi:hypothetical protein
VLPITFPVYNYILQVASGADKKGSSSADGADNGIVPAWSTQLAEVALPIKFKLKNIEETERAAVEDAARTGSGPSNIAAAYRFNSYERAPKLHPAMEGFVDEAALAHVAAGEQSNKRPLKSSDDRALDQYKKVSFLQKNNNVLHCDNACAVLCFLTEANEPPAVGCPAR